MQRVAFTVGTKLITGVVANLKQSKGYHGNEVINVVLDEPEERTERGEWTRDAVTQAWHMIPGKPKKPRLMRKVFDASRRVLVLDKLGE